MEDNDDVQNVYAILIYRRTDGKAELMTGLGKSPYAAFASLLVIVTYGKVRLIPRNSRALPLELFARPFNAVLDESSGD